MAKDKVQERKEAKPVKLFTLDVIVWDDGRLSGAVSEIRTLGRNKNQKCVVPGYDDFVSCVRSLLPSALPAIDKLVEALFDDIEITDAEDCEKIGKVVVDLFNDGFITVDFMEIVKGDRGAPKNWRMQPNEFQEVIEARCGTLTSVFEPLIENRGSTLVDTSSESTKALLDEATNLADEGGGYVGEVEFDEEETQVVT